MKRRHTRPLEGEGRAADALRAIPVVERILRVLREFKAALPPVPSPGTTAPQTIDNEISTMESLRVQLSSVAGAMGVNEDRVMLQALRTHRRRPVRGR